MQIERHLQTEFKYKARDTARIAKMHKECGDTKNKIL